MTVLAALAFAVAAESATVVLRGGKRVEVDSFALKGNLVVLKYANGRVESYPLAAVDLEKTRAANPEPESSPAASAGGPHSPFFEARSVPGSTAVLVTDADVLHLEEPAGTETKEAAVEGPEGAQISLVTYERKKVAEGEWEITATIVNQGNAPASGITGNVRLLGVDGKPLGTGSGTYAGQLAAKQQGTMTVKVSALGDVGQVGFEFQWVSVQPAKPSPTPDAGLTTPPGAAPVGTRPVGYGVVPQGSAPSAVPGNPLGLAPINQVGTPPQVPQPTPAPVSPPPA